ncbi:uncharacterized protein LOC131215014 [Anopheles bellator]|uniref:uncharacterized protein LOC131215014 n=1 Tax=Anopheles bellator TaxID=139047 RepID=UPI00264A313C|nr:uncharacterized protein LOC131215014 [Anopheles bellator]
MYTFVLLCTAVGIATAAGSTTETAACASERSKVCLVKSLNDGSEWPDLANRTQLQVASGHLKMLSRPMTDRMEKLRTLQLEGLQLESVFVRANFEELRLSGNRIVNLSTDGRVSASSSAHRLKVLDLRSNRFANVSQLAPFRKLVELRLDGNAISVLEMGPFQGMTGLRWLSVAGNRIASVVPVPSPPLELGELVHLSLASNQLQVLEMGTWQLPYLETLLLDDNQLVELAGLQNFEQFVSLARLNLVGNRWSCPWLTGALADAGTIVIDRSQVDCSFEQVAGVCCQFAAATPGSAEQPFVAETRIAREKMRTIEALQERLPREWDLLVERFEVKLQDQLNKALAAGAPVTRKDVEKLRGELATLVEHAKELEATMAQKVQNEKRLVHFMIDMKNRLLGQAIETDALVAQWGSEWIELTRRFN